MTVKGWIPSLECNLSIEHVNGDFAGDHSTGTSGTTSTTTVGYR